MKPRKNALDQFSRLAFLCLATLAMPLFGQTGAPAGLEENAASEQPEINPGLPTILIAGDSTAATGNGIGQMGWAVPFVEYFDQEKANVVNRARGGAAVALLSPKVSGMRCSMM